MYLIYSFWFIYLYLMNDNKEDDHKKLSSLHQNSKKTIKQTHKNNKISASLRKHVHIWGKAAIAEYFWIHICEGALLPKPGVMLEEGNIDMTNLKLSYLTGPYLLPHTADAKVVNLVLIVNGRVKKTIDKSKTWLDSLTDPRKFPRLKNLGIILLGSESCNNDWFWEYYNKFSLIKFAFIVYDINIQGKHSVYQWPLGVATYRKFPLISKNSVDIYNQRKYRCNFLGTVYKNSSRDVLNKILEGNKHRYNCYVHVRMSWQPQETTHTLNQYHDALQQSDLTLCPVGINSETYRIYEAMSYGSIPVLEDIVTNDQCSTETNQNIEAPYRLLKEHNAPVIFVNHWSELSNLIENDLLLSQEEIIERRKNILDWYELFRYKIREQFLDVLKDSFE